ncbi:unnamed protein product [Chrysoparadoxa australica]
MPIRPLRSHPARPWPCLICSPPVKVAPISPSPPEVITKGLDRMMLEAKDVVVDLGCGDGRWLTEAAKRAGCSCHGYDINRDMLAKGRERLGSEEQHISSLVTLTELDMFEAPLSQATWVIAYLFRDGLARMQAKLESNMFMARRKSYQRGRQ